MIQFQTIMTVESKEIPDCKELATCTELIIYATPKKPNIDSECIYVNPIIPSIGFSTIIAGGIHHYHKVGRVSVGGDFTLHEPEIRSLNSVFLENTSELREHTPNIILTHEGGIFAESDIYYGADAFLTKSDLESQVSLALKDIPEEMIKRFDYLK